MNKLLFACVIFLSYIANGIVEKLPEFPGNSPDSGVYAVGEPMQLSKETICDGWKVELPVNKDVDFTYYPGDPFLGADGKTYEVVYFVVNQPAMISYLRVTMFCGMRDPVVYKVSTKTWVFVDKK